jgi:predicted amidophosphoribosyltransferase
MILHYSLIFVLAFLGAVSAHAVCHHGTRALQIRTAVAKSHIETRAQLGICSHCKSHVARYEEFEDGTVLCANCVRERQHGK